MDQLTTTYKVILVLTVGLNLIVAGVGCMSRDREDGEYSRRNYKSGNAEPHCYEWDSPGSCVEPDYSRTCHQDPPPPERVCDKTKALKKFSQVKRQQETMSQTRFSSSCGCATSSTNTFGLPNLASFYLGARAFLVDNTTTVTPVNCNSHWCIPKVDIVIKPGILTPGKTFRFHGRKGRILIEIPEPALISGFTLTHPLMKEMPTGYSTSTPKEFTVFGLRCLRDKDPLELGAYIYKCPNSRRAQTFPVKSECVASEVHKYVLISIEDNYGNANYTEFYKFEVHGILPHKIHMQRCGDSGGTTDCNKKVKQHGRWWPGSWFSFDN